MANSDMPIYNGNGNGNGTMWRWVISGVCAALLAYVLYDLNVSWNIASQYATRGDAQSHFQQDDRRFEQLKDGVEKHYTDVAIKMRSHDQELSLLTAKVMLLEGRYSDVRETLGEIRAGLVTLNTTVGELKQMISRSTQRRSSLDDTETLPYHFTPPTSAIFEKWVVKPDKHFNYWSASAVPFFCEDELLPMSPPPPSIAVAKHLGSDR